MTKIINIDGVDYNGTTKIVRDESCTTQQWEALLSRWR